jgi:hypothetical protein
MTCRITRGFISAERDTHIMEIPHRIKQQLGDEELVSAVSLGDEDVICFTSTRTLIYRGEGLLSDDSIEEYSHDVERLDVSESRRKMGFTLTHMDKQEKFTVAHDRGEAVLERLIRGILGTAGVIEPDESIEGVFRFSELTLIITEGRLVKHVGTYVWDEDFEEYPYSEVTGLDFEDGSVATQIVISVNGRPQRIKAPSKDANLVEHTLTNALFSYYEVESLDQLNHAISETSSDTQQDDGDSQDEGLVSSDIALDDSISPLVGGDDEDEALDSVPTDEPEETVTTTSETGASNASSATSTATQSSSSTATSGQGVDQSAGAIDPEEFEAMKDQLGTLTTAVKRQNKLLKKQHETINQLVEELKRERQ